MASDANIARAAAKSAAASATTASQAAQDAVDSAEAASAKAAELEAGIGGYVENVLEGEVGDSFRDGIEESIFEEIPDQIAGQILNANPAIAQKAVELATNDVGLSRTDYVENTSDEWLGFFRPDDNDKVNPLGGAVYDVVEGWDWVVATEATRGGTRVLRVGARSADGGRTTLEDSFGSRLTSDHHIEVKGDSISRAWAGDLEAALKLLGYKGRVRNWSVGGENTPTILARTGGSPFMATVSGGVIPASGAVSIDLTDTFGLAAVDVANTPRLNPLAQASNGFNPVRLTCSDGTVIEGVVTGTNVNGLNPFTFTRSKAGTSKAAKNPVPITTWAARNTMGGLQIIAVGQNDNNDLVGDDFTYTERFDQIQHLISRMNAGRKRYLIVTAFSGGLGTRQAEEAEANRRWGRHAFLSRQWLASESALDISGATPVAGDYTDINAGTVPRSFFDINDTVHPNAAGRKALVQGVINRLVELEYI